MNNKNLNMVDIAGRRIIDIYESIMSEGVLGALGGAALGSAVGAVGGGMVGNPDKVATLNNTKFEVNPTSNGNIANSLTVDGTGVKGALKFNSTGAAVGAGAGALAGGALGAMATSDDNKNENENENEDDNNLF